VESSRIGDGLNFIGDVVIAQRDRRPVDDVDQLGKCVAEVRIARPSDW
jgi:hypothetical protein